MSLPFLRGARLSSFLVAMALAACQGQQGEAGPKGDTGATGPMGAMGAPGSTTFAGMTDKLTNANVDDGTLDGAKLMDATVTKAKLGLGAVGTEQLEDGGVTSAKLAMASVGSAQLQPRSVRPEHMAFWATVSCSPTAMMPADGATSVVRSNLVPAVRFPDAMNSRAYCQVTLPNDVVGQDFAVQLYWATESVASGAVSWNAVLTATPPGTDLATAVATTLASSEPVGGAGVVQSTFSQANIFGAGSGVPVAIVIERDGQASADTAAGAADLLGVVISQTPAVLPP